MATPFLAEIRLVGFNFAPRGWVLCNGQTLPINQNQAIFTLIGTYYGGNGTSTFQLPNLQGCSPLHMGSLAGNNYVIGGVGGAANITLTTGEMPTHTHSANGVSTVAGSGSPVGNAWADSASNPYGLTPNTTMNGASVGQTGSGDSHENMPPYLVLNFIIALSGIFPSRN
jgi:microcystin-dependent protein